VKYKINCHSCNEEFDLDKKSFEEHFKKYHPKKVNCSGIYLKCTIIRELENKGDKQ